MWWSDAIINELEKLSVGDEDLAEMASEERTLLRRSPSVATPVAPTLARRAGQRTGTFAGGRIGSAFRPFPLCRTGARRSGTLGDLSPRTDAGGWRGGSTVYVHEKLQCTPMERLENHGFPRKVALSRSNCKNTLWERCGSTPECTGLRLDGGSISCGSTMVSHRLCPDPVRTARLVSVRAASGLPRVGMERTDWRS